MEPGVTPATTPSPWPAESSQVTITLESNLDPYLYLREGEARSGDFLHENDDIVPANTNSRIQETLAAGTYTIEATTFNPGAMGSFTLTVSGLGSTTTPPTPTDPCVGELSGDGAVTGQWAAGCESAVGARGYARYYTFTLAESSQVTITLESNLDPYLYLREGEARSGDFLHENDDIVSRQHQLPDTGNPGGWDLHHRGHHLQPWSDGQLHPDRQRLVAGNGHRKAPSGRMGLSDREGPFLAWYNMGSNERRTWVQAQGARVLPAPPGPGHRGTQPDVHFDPKLKPRWDVHIA